MSSHEASGVCSCPGKREVNNGAFFMIDLPIIRSFWEGGNDPLRSGSCYETIWRVNLQISVTLKHFEKKFPKKRFMDQLRSGRHRAHSHSTTRIGGNAVRGSTMHLDVNDDARVIGAGTAATLDGGTVQTVHRVPICQLLFWLWAPNLKTLDGVASTFVNFC